MATEPRAKQRQDSARKHSSALDDTLEAGVRRHGLAEYSKMKQEYRAANKPRFVIRAIFWTVVLSVVVGGGYVAAPKVQAWLHPAPVNTTPSKLPEGTVE